MAEGTRNEGPVILVVDDEPDIVEYLSEVLEDHGFRPAGFTDAGKALEAARASPPDLVILDVMMPGRTGLSLYRTLRSLPGTERVPILFVSGAAREEDFEGGLPAVRRVAEILGVEGVGEASEREESPEVLRRRLEELLARADGKTLQEVLQALEKSRRS
jgi:CheY-like chemotaxis protein